LAIVCILILTIVFHFAIAQVIIRTTNAVGHKQGILTVDSVLTKAKGKEAREEIVDGSLQGFIKQKQKQKTKNNKIFFFICF